ncbi:MAG: coenzyme F420-0:L-glutamate ligase [Candidatus Thorarchaeota archaeon]
MPQHRLEIIPIQDIPLIEKGDEIVTIVIRAIEHNKISLQQNDVLVIAHSIISLAEGNVHEIVNIHVSEKASSIAEKIGCSPERVQLALDEALEIIREEPILITRTHHGIITDFSGVDASNAPSGFLLTLPRDPDKSAELVSKGLKEMFGIHIPVIIADTQGRPWRKGAQNLAIGVFGMSPFTENKGKVDLYGRPLQSSLVCLADELAAASELVMGQSNEGIPAVLIRGVEYTSAVSTSSEIVRSQREDLFQ